MLVFLIISSMIVFISDNIVAKILVFLGLVIFIALNREIICNLFIKYYIYINNDYIFLVNKNQKIIKELSVKDIKRVAIKYNHKHNGGRLIIDTKQNMNKNIMFDNGLIHKIKYNYTPTLILDHVNNVNELYQEIIDYKNNSNALNNTCNSHVDDMAIDNKRNLANDENIFWDKSSLYYLSSLSYFLFQLVVSSIIMLVLIILDLGYYSIWFLGISMIFVIFNRKLNKSCLNYTLTNKRFIAFKKGCKFISKNSIYNDERLTYSVSNSVLVENNNSKNNKIIVVIPKLGMSDFFFANLMKHIDFPLSTSVIKIFGLSVSEVKELLYELNQLPSDSC